MLPLLALGCVPDPDEAPTAAASAAEGARAGAVAAEPDWTDEGDQASAWFGQALGSAGDVDADGFDDLIVGVEAASGAFPAEGAVHVYRGSPGGLPGTPAWTATGGQARAWFGVSAATAGDVNGDGFGDVIVGAELYDDGAADDGIARVFLGSAAGLSAAPAWTVGGNQAGAYLGSSVASAGDVNGDGFDDVIVGARRFDGGQADEGEARVYLGSAAGPSPVPVWTVRGGQASAFLGTTVASAGDVDGDGFDDVLVGAPDHDDGQSREGVAHLYLGSPTGPSPAPDWTLHGDQSFASLGSALASAGDVNGDGFDDVVVGVALYDPGGVAWVFLGSAAGLPQAPSWTVVGAPGADLGSSVASAGDVDGDGFDDLAVSAKVDDLGSEERVEVGVVRVYRGSAAGLASSAAWVAEGEDFHEYFGAPVASAGDVNGDGLADLAVGSNRYAGEANEGVAFVYTDLAADTDADGVGDTLDRCPDATDPAQPDQDGDGIGDVCEPPRLAVEGEVASGNPVSLVASNLLPGEVVRFGASADAAVPLGPCLPPFGGLCLDLGPRAVDLGPATADAAGVATLPLVVPALDPNGVYRVQALVRRGPGGDDSLKTNAVVFDGEDLDWDADGLSDALELVIGTDPALADTDGDGLSDALEAPRFDPFTPDTDGDGALDGADVCWGGDDALDGDGDGARDACDTCPADPDPAQADADGDGRGDACDGAVLVASRWNAEGNQEDALFGGEVRSAGDVNGDGFDDVIVGAHFFTAGQSREGGAFVYQGTAAGLSLARAWSAEGDQVDAFLGAGVASAGDVNGDGYGDVIVGASQFSSGQPAEGQARVYLGSAAGLSGAPAWTAQGQVADADFGGQVASAGDVNGDGFDDVVVGAPSLTRANTREGEARLYLGSAAGLSAQADWMDQGGRADAGFGRSVASAGDVNGDGFDDLIVGGTTRLYLGSPTGPSRRPDWTPAGWSTFRTIASSAGDVNGDGFDDVLVGVIDYGSGPFEQEEGRALLYLGSPDGPAPTPLWSVEGEQAFADAWVVAAAGDVDGDGFDDVLVGSPDHDDTGIVRLYLGSPTGPTTTPAWRGRVAQQGSSYGGAVASAGDVDGDGLSDVIVGGRFYDGDLVDEGGAWVYHGRTP